MNETAQPTGRRGLQSVSIWWFAFGYFACYAPYSALTKALSRGMLPGVPRVAGTSILPLSVSASLVGMVVFLSAMGWWRYATQWKLAGRSLPRPAGLILVSGLCTSGIVMTTTLSYTFTGVSIVLVMLLMRGGVLILAPLVDFVSRRKVAWYSWVALSLSLCALLVALGSDGDWRITGACAFNVSIYLACYFVRLRLMSRLAKSSDSKATARYFVEEQMVATPVSLIALAVLASWGGNEMAADLRVGFLEVGGAALAVVMVIGLLSQGTGVFGGLILLDPRENAYCVPVNRASSILAGVVASFLLTLLPGGHLPRTSELVGAGIIIVAMGFLSVPTLLKARAARVAA